MSGRFRLSLRDILWLTLLCAAVVAAMHTHRRDANQLRQLESAHVAALKGTIPPRPLPDATRDELQQKLKILTNSDLMDRLPKDDSRNDYGLWYHCLLSEMAGRKLTGFLMQYFRQAWAKGGSEFQFTRRSKLAQLTAICRSAGKPDPLGIHLRVDPDVKSPCLTVDVENTLDGWETIESEPYWGGTWEWVVTDRSGERARASNYFPASHPGDLPLPPKRGDIATVDDRVDLREFIAPPRSGIYQVHAIYRDDFGLPVAEGERELIYFESEPITIRVHNPEDPPLIAIEAGIPLAVALVPLSLVASSWYLARRSGSQANLRRDSLWALALLAVGIVWFVDQQSLWEQTRLALPDHQAPWTMEAVE